MKTLIPCAGFGTRMNMPTNKSKELLPDPESPNCPIIEWTLAIAKNPHFIVRKEKQDLIMFLEDGEFNYQLVEPTKEWPDSVLKSEPYWEENNCLVLPDTRFQPITTIRLIETLLEDNDLVIAFHEVSDISKWGAILGDYLWEKPKIHQEGYAWGVLGFKKSIGKELFTAMLNRVPFDFSNLKRQFIFLDEFKDITRG